MRPLVGMREERDVPNVSGVPRTSCTFMGSAERGVKPVFLSLSPSPPGKGVLNRKSCLMASFSFLSALCVRNDLNLVNLAFLT